MGCCTRLSYISSCRKGQAFRPRPYRKYLLFCVAWIDNNYKITHKCCRLSVDRSAQNSTESQKLICKCLFPLTVKDKALFVKMMAVLQRDHGSSDFRVSCKVQRNHIICCMFLHASQSFIVLYVMITDCCDLLYTVLDKEDQYYNNHSWSRYRKGCVCEGCASIAIFLNCSVYYY